MKKVKRIFTNEELKERSKDFHQLVQEALEKADIETARYWAKKNEETKDYIHDMYLAALPRILSLIHERFGDDVVTQVWRDTVKSFIEPVWIMKDRLIKEGGLRAYVDFYVDIWRQHCGKFKVGEDDEKIIITHQPCGSGGQLVDRGVYDDGVFAERKYQGKGYHTFGKEGLPLYCGHCVWAHMAYPMNVTGEPLWCHDYDHPFPRKPGDSCIHYIFKDPAKIPDKYYDMVGVKKPKRESR